MENILTPSCRRENMYFRGGSPEHVFEYGCKMIPTWRDYKEEEVLCQRVAEGLKPLASIVIYDDKHLEWVYSLVLQHGLLCFEYMNSWDVLVINIIRDKDTTLGSLMTNVERKIFQKVEPKASAICKLKLSRYLNCDSPDIYKGDTPMECGLAYGYNLIETLRLYYHTVTAGGGKFQQLSIIHTIFLGVGVCGS